MNELTINFFSDPGHGWAEVDRDVLTDLKISDKITYYSYQKNNKVYLEEDCDLSIFVDALSQRGIKVKFAEKHTNNDSPIRNYERYRFSN